MLAGKLDRRIRLEAATTTRGLDGHPVRMWPPDGGSLLREVWAGVLPVRGQEGFAAQQFAAKAEVTFRIRYPYGLAMFPTPSEDLRIVYEGRNYDIVSVTETGRREGLDITATARAEAAA